MPVAPEAQTLLDLLAAAGGPASHELPPEEAREGYRGLALLAPSTEECGSIEDRTIPGPAGDIPVRVYRPADVENPAIFVWIHGGGWTIGDLDTHDGVCRAQCARGGVLVVSVDYRLAPEHPFPAGYDDCVAVLQWVGEHGSELGGDPSRLGVGGDSAGGNLSAAAALALRDAGGPELKLQVLIYPGVDLTMSFPSIEENAEGYLLAKETMEWFGTNYVADLKDPKDPRVSPLFAKKHAGLPAALVITAEFDPLRDEGEAYAEKLIAAGVDTVCSRYDGMIHAFYQLEAMMPQATAAMAETVAAFDRHLK